MTISIYSIRLSPVISSGFSIHITSNIVGAISLIHPSFNFTSPAFINVILTGFVP